MSALDSMKGRFETYIKENSLPNLKPHFLREELERGWESAIPEVAALTQDQIKECGGWVSRFCETLKRVHAEERVITLLCIKAMRNGYSFHAADDGEIGQSIIGNSVAEVLDILTAVDESSICFKNKVTGQLLRFYLIFGNSPEELIADHTDHPDAETIYQAVISAFNGV